MALPLEDYALIGDCQTAALVGRDGSVDWLCLPRFDSGACFAALLGTPDNGRWLISPRRAPARVTRRYRPGTLVLETEFHTEEGTVAVIDFMPLGGEAHDLVRVVEGRAGRVAMHTELVIRTDYGSIVPWVRREGAGWTAVAGPDQLSISSEVELSAEDRRVAAGFEVVAGQRLAFSVRWHPSHRPPAAPLDAEQALSDTEGWWRAWSQRCRYPGEWAEAVQRSLITLKALTFAPTGGIVAAPTTSLPEKLGGVRNWDYRYCWLRDASFTLLALLEAGYRDEAVAWRDWLLRAVAGRPDQMHIMYGLAGQRRLPELELDWLAGYEGSRPVRTGNLASTQRQHDIYGEVMDVIHQCLVAGLGPGQDGWEIEGAMLDFLESAWDQPDDGIWEMRGPQRHFTHSKMMAWVAFDRAVKTAAGFDFPGPIDRWRSVRQEIHDEVCRQGFDGERGAFVQFYGSGRLDASLLMMPLVGFLPATDPRVRGTIEAVERELTVDGFVRRYETDPEVDGLPPGEATFLLCSFWLVGCLALLGRRGDARRLFERLLSVRNDVGLLAEGYDPEAGRMLGNFPQAFSHIGLVNAAVALGKGPESPPA